MGGSPEPSDVNQTCKRTIDIVLLHDKYGKMDPYLEIEKKKSQFRIEITHLQGVIKKVGPLPD